MARGVKTGGKDWKPGQQPKSPGRPKSPPELKAARKLTKTAFEEIANHFIHLTKQEMREAKLDPARTYFELMIIEVILKAQEYGDHGRMEWILSRLVGKVADKLEVTDKSQAEAMTQEERQKRLAELRAMREKSSGSKA